MSRANNQRPLLGRFKNIRSALMWSFSVLVIFALLLFMLIALNYTKQTVQDNAIKSYSKITKQVNYDIDSYIDSMETTSTMFYNNVDVKNYLYNTTQTEDRRQEEKDRILTLFGTILSTRSDISNIGFACENGEYLINNGLSQMSHYNTLQELSWYEKAQQSKEGISLSGSHVQNMVKDSYEWVITLCRVITNKATQARDGFFFIDLNYSAISTLCDSSKIGNEGYVFIIDQNGSLIYHPQQQLIYGGLKDEKIDEVMDCQEDHLITGTGDSQALYTMSRSDKTGWTVVSVTYMSELLKNSRQTTLLYIAIAILLIITVLVVSSLVARTITRPVEKLRDSMEQVQKGHFSNADVEVTSDNEIGSLSRSFNIMTEQIQQLMEQNVFEQQQKRKSELRVLQSQINPHFLYNTLDSIIWMAEGGKNQEVVAMTAALSKLFRQSISNENEETTLSLEIEYVKSYLLIQKMRYQDKLEYTVDMEPEIANVNIIKLTLQPIVENAIYHGLKYKETLGHLSVRAFALGNDIRIEIKDDGVGMSEEELAHIFDEHKVNYRSNGVGVYNVQKRLQLYYGNAYGLSYISREGEGTTAVIEIPRQGGEYR